MQLGIKSVYLDNNRRITGLGTVENEGGRGMQN